MRKTARFLITTTPHNALKTPVSQNCVNNTFSGLSGKLREYSTKIFHFKKTGTFSIDSVSNAQDKG
jgi:hypothetical protein